MWFFQVQAAFQANRVQGDSAKFNLVIAKLDPDTIQEVADVLRSPPAANRYESLKTVILNRLTDSADRQLYKLLTQLELGDRKPSQLLREMRSLAGDRVSDDVIRVKWLDLLPSKARRLLTIFKAPNLDELTRAADELVDSDPSVMAAGYPSQQAPIPSPTPPRDPLAGELTALRQTLSQLHRAHERKPRAIAPARRPPAFESLAKPFTGTSARSLYFFKRRCAIQHLLVSQAPW